jgi:hypothetical protein
VDCEHFEGAGGDFAGVGHRAEEDAVGVEDLDGCLVEHDVQGLSDQVVADVDLGVAVWILPVVETVRSSQRAASGSSTGTPRTRSS